jgi:hypothetical protein
MGLRVVLVLCALALPAATRAGADEWYDAYRQGVRALAQGHPESAIGPLERAIAQRPEPGRNIVTYGTNVEREYFPYLRLAEAQVLLRDVARARAALAQSEKWGLEPSDQRQRLTARIEELIPKPTPTSAPPATAPPATTAAAVVTTVPAAPPPAPTLAPPSPTPAVHRPPASAAPGVAAPPPTVAAPAPFPPGTVDHVSPAGTIEVVSQPPGASVYVDDELVGTTDPEWGRLVRSGVAPGRHRVRLALAGHQDVAEDVEVKAGARVDFRKRLADEQAVDRRPYLWGTLAVLLLGLAIWAWRRLAAEPAPSAGLAPTPRSADATPARGTPPGMGSPGVRRDGQGREFFGEYRLLEPLGRGGMASVFKAERGGELSALKRPLYAFLEEPEFLERFLREADIGRTLHHPNVIRILERGEVEGVPFFTMELLAGETLQARVERHGALPARQATEIIAQIAEALDYAHSKGVVHRDLKPSNVMVLADGTVKVMDFGIARARRFEGMTVTGAFLGSPDYIAPEAIEGKEADARSDLYSLGVTFYETLTGRRPFAGDTRSPSSAAPDGRRRRRVARADVPPELERLVLRLLSKEPADRIASAEDLVRELRDYLNRVA